MNFCATRNEVQDWPVDLLYDDQQLQTLVQRVEKFRGRLAPHLHAWARHGVHFGLSPWNSRTWIGLLYGRIYRTATDFALHALEEYAQCFSVGSIEFGPYSLPVASTLLQIKSQVPAGFGFLAAVTHEMMMYRLPYGHPDPGKRGKLNPGFLDPGLMHEIIIPALQMLEPHVRVVVLRISRIYPTETYPFATFLDRLDRFLAALPRTYRYAVELRNREYLLPAYFACLGEHHATHALCHGDGMPPVLEHVLRPDVLTTDILVLRTDHERRMQELSARCQWNPMNAELQLGILETVRRCIDAKRTLYVDVGDQPEGSAPLSLVTLMTMLDPDLAKLSPFRRKAA